MPSTVAISTPRVTHKPFGSLSASKNMGRESSKRAPVSDHRNNVRGLFDQDAGDVASIVKNNDGAWSISVAEATESRKTKQTSSYTLYVTTPTHNLTLIRSVTDITELHSRLKSGMALSLPALPDLPHDVPQASGRKFFQTVSRALSPASGRSRNALTSESNSVTSNTLAPPASAPVTPDPDDATRTSSHSTTTQLATYFTAIASMAALRDHKAWKRFVRVGSDDYQSIRVERRVRKVRSDVAEHIISSVAPRNVNVGEALNESDMDDEGGRTEDDLESAEEASSHPAKARKREATSTSIEGAASEKEASSKAIDMIPEETPSEEKQEDQKQLDEHRRRRRSTQNKVTVNDFEMIRVLGKGCAGKVLLVRHSNTKGLYAMKSIHKRHVLAHQELQHTLTEQSVLKRMAKEVMNPFVVRLWWSFHDRNNLYLVMDFHPGGDLATQLSRWGRLGRDRARFYAAEILEGVEGLHKAGVIYRDLKPENVLIGADGHIVLSDFGLSKEFESQQRSNGTSTPPPSSPTKTQTLHFVSSSDDASATPSVYSWLDERQTTTTFCGTAEYLAPEVLQGLAYSFEVDWWSFGTMLYEMLTGITPFWADTHADMYARVLRDPLVFPEDRVLDQDTKSILRGLLQRNPTLRMKEPRIRKHPYFSMIEWDHIYHKRYIPPYIPPIDPDNEIDTQNFDETFLEMAPTVTHEVDSTKDETAAPKDENDLPITQDADADDMDLDDKQTSEQRHMFDGYSFRGRKDSESVKSVLSATLRDAGPVADTTDADQPTTNVAAEDMVVDVPAEVDEEDDEANARAAVAALAHLEHEASLEAIALTQTNGHESHLSPDSGTPTADQIAPATSKVAPSSAGHPSNGIIREIDDEDEDWDMIDGSGTGAELQSEMNGGKGANLFARGVVDTYRLLRRQESTRLASSTSQTSSLAGRPFSRLGKRRNDPSGGSSTRIRPSRSVMSTSTKHTIDEDGITPSESKLSIADSNVQATSPLLTPADDTPRAGGSPSLSGSEENKHQARLKKMKRFTTFFEPSSHR